MIAGQVIDVAPDPSTNCQVKVQSFDMFKAVHRRACAAGEAAVARREHRAIPRSARWAATHRLCRNSV